MYTDKTVSLFIQVVTYVRPSKIYNNVIVEKHVS